MCEGVIIYAILFYFFKMDLLINLLICLQPNLQSKTQKENVESEQFWDLLGGKSEYPSQKIVRSAESDPRLFSCTFSNGMNFI